MNFKKLESLILNNNKFLITTHVNPDADAIGSEIAFHLMLKKLGKESYIINHSLTPYNLEFLDESNVIHKFDKKVHSNLFNEVDVLVALDFNRTNRLVSLAEDFIKSNKLKICIDHHQDEEDFTDHQFIYTNYSATGHIIFDFIKITGIIKLDLAIANSIYAAIMTDTGSFRFERTTPELHRIAAELIEIGVNPGEVYNNIYEQNYLSKVKLLAKALETLSLVGKNNEIGYMFLTLQDFKNVNGLESDTDNFVNFSLSVENVKIGMLFIELKDGCKISFRSKGIIPMNELAAEFGGGGHINAAGARFFDRQIMDIIPTVIKKAEDYLENYTRK